MRRTVLVVLSCVLAIPACGSAGGDATTTLDPGPNTSSTAVTSTTAPSTTTSTATATTAATTTTTALETTTTGDTTTTAPSVPVEGPIPGSAWIVVGVVHDDVLNVRATPGIGSAIVGELAPTADGIVVTGTAMQVGSVVWWQVGTAIADGWVSSRHLAVAGATDDIASAIVEANSGIRPTGETMNDLADAVLAVVSADEVVVVASETVSGDIGEITIDVFDVGDDAIRGRRLHIFGQRTGDSGFGLYAVEATALCWRAADAAGLCV